MPGRSSSSGSGAPPAQAVLRRVAQHLRQSSPAAAKACLVAAAPAASAASSALALGSTNPDGSLAQEALRRFEDDGYCVFPGFLDADHVERLLVDLAQLPTYDGETRGGPRASTLLLSSL